MSTERHSGGHTIATDVMADVPEHPFIQAIQVIPTVTVSELYNSDCRYMMKLSQEGFHELHRKDVRLFEWLGEALKMQTLDPVDEVYLARVTMGDSKQAYNEYDVDLMAYDTVGFVLYGANSSSVRHHILLDMVELLLDAYPHWRRDGRLVRFTSVDHYYKHRFDDKWGHTVAPI